MFPFSSQSPSLSHLNPVPSSINTSYPPSSLTNTHKTICSKMNPLKTTINNPTDSPNYTQLIFNYPPSASSIPPPQTQHTISPLTPYSFHPSFPSRNKLRILRWIRPRRTELIQFLSQYNFISVQESHLSSDSTFRIPGYKTL